MNLLKPWAQGPFELIVHAETHLREGEDFDRRMALISFDNSIEVSITTYLTLNPIQRNGAQYRREDIDRWLKNYHTKIDFFVDELRRRSIPEDISKSNIIWYHDHRNEQYHGGSRGVPEIRVLDEVRKISLWVFSVLFSVQDVEQILDDVIAQRKLDSGLKPERDREIDRLIDAENGLIEICGKHYYVSETLYSLDPVAYWELGEELKTSVKETEQGSTEEAE